MDIDEINARIDAQNQRIAELEAQIKTRDEKLARVTKEYAEHRTKAARDRQDATLAGALSRAGADATAVPYAADIIRKDAALDFDEAGALKFGAYGAAAGKDLDAIAREWMRAHPSFTKAHAEAVTLERAREAGDPNVLNGVELIERGLGEPGSGSEFTQRGLTGLVPQWSGVPRSNASPSAPKSESVIDSIDRYLTEHPGSSPEWISGGGR